MTFLSGIQLYYPVYDFIVISQKDTIADHSEKIILYTANGRSGYIRVQGGKIFTRVQAFNNEKEPLGPAYIVEHSFGYQYKKVDDPVSKLITIAKMDF